MSIEQLELILSDAYQMDVSFPAIFGHRKEFMQSSYSIWSVNELLEYVSSELYPKNNASIAEIEEIVRCFKSMMSKYYHMRQDTQLMFSIDFNHRKTVLDDGLEVYVIEMVWTPDTNWCDEEDFTME